MKNESVGVKGNRTSSVLQYELLVAAATVAAHSSCAQSFRQRDVRFFVELFENWAAAGPTLSFELQNTQLARYLESLTADGFVRQNKRQRIPTYRLTRVGLFELLTRLSSRERRRAPEHFYFVVYFLSAYRERLEDLVRKEGPQFPPSLKIELDALLDVEQLVDDELRDADRVLSKLNTRITDAERTNTIAKTRLRAGVPLAELVAEIERDIPYELNSRKPLHELISDIPPDQRQWEFVEGTMLRRQLIWIPQRSIQERYIDTLKELKRGFRKL